MQKAIWKTIYNSTYVKKKTKLYLFTYVCVCINSQSYDRTHTKLVTLVTLGKGWGYRGRDIKEGSVYGLCV